MRILEAFGEPISYGGQEAFVMNVLENMDRTDIEADLLSPYYCDNDRIVSVIRSYGGDVYTLGCEFSPGGFRNKAAGPIKDFLSGHSYDVIHIHSGSNSMLAMFAKLASQAGIPRIIVHSHCTGRHGIKHFASKMLTSRSLEKYPTAYCACSREAGEWRFPADICRGRLNIINNGINVEKFRYNEDMRAKMRRNLNITGGTVLIGCIGRLTYQKNQGFLLDVMSRIRERAAEGDICSSGLNYRLMLVGDGEDRAALEKRAADLGMTGEVIFTGAVDNVQDYLQAMDVVAMPSRYEGLAIAVIEAQAAGLGIVASDAIPEAAAVTDSITFLPLDDPEKWTDELLRPHARHPEQADQVAGGGYGIRETASVVRQLYIR